MMKKSILGIAATALLASSAFAQNLDRDLRKAVDGYTALVTNLQANNNLPQIEWSSYVKTTDVDEAWTVSAIPGLFAFRHIAPNMDKNPAEFEKWMKNKGYLFESRAIVLFLPNGAGFITRTGMYKKNPDALIVYDKDKGYRNGADALPYLAQILPHMHLDDLPKVGNKKPTFVLISSPSCPYSAALDPKLVESGLSFRVNVTFGVNPMKDYPYVNRVYCAKDKVAEWRKQVATKPLPDIKMFDAQCDRQELARYETADLNLLTGENLPTPSFVFADGTILSGADKLEQVKQKSQEMERKKLFFQ
ncbi:thioredoxin fold domain-containing protein [Undibacterium squillarum]|uniref:Thioredoxin-like fold domain-containing protein n=1 Tax=Undibacterium squillarum TaxID=1131567 RepID=A0ABQ2XWM8_9BURK|nr:thioredoxin fold domain-containing protein [Undibacterium squillarum]GGX36417.1 hypothetical protein GCM10010946_12740 [Undibacterium squillarum]